MSDTTIREGDEVAEPLDGVGKPEPPRPSSTDVVELMLSADEAAKFLDSLGALNWRQWPSAPPSISVGGRLAYSEIDLRWWADKWRNRFCDPDSMKFDFDGNVITPL